MTKIYLAGPDVFAPDPQALGTRKKALCAQHGLDGVFPMGLVALDTSRAKRDQGLQIFDVMERALSDCDAMIVNLTPFHGPSVDVGTAVEIGFMRAQNKPIFAYSNSDDHFADRVSRFWQGDVTQRENGALQGADGMEIEAFDMCDNLMVHGSVERSTGVLVTRDVPPGAVYDDLTAFEACVAQAAAWLAERAGG
ncbi:nucleoside 2-deoxyribosyltransferase [Salipiger abyssi]|uniref:nucleoside 2-deoxyribosyltransferase n=1 Tax=Salipiger abyssi TaxID=1250539 RepID=UPI0040594F2C